MPEDRVSPGRSGKARNQNPEMHVREKSDRDVVPTKRPNKGAPAAPAEAVEGRSLAKGNAQEQAAVRTQRRETASSGLAGVRKAAMRDKKARFTALLHHVTPELLRESYERLNPRAATGVDETTWKGYGVGLEDRLQDLHERVHKGTFRAHPSRRIYIPKADGKKRPIGIASLEDKIVQQALVSILNEIYETDFKGFSYGFRPERSQHDALDALWVAIMQKKVSWILDADISRFFDTIDHQWMLRFLEHRIADRRVLRLIRKFLRAGVSEEGEWSKTTEGTPQGAVISPLLANVYLHYVLDVWIEQWRKRHARGEVYVVRYADDAVLGFQYRSDAEQCKEALGERLKKFNLNLHPEKTRLLEFGRFAAETRRKRGEGKPETFNFLGFTHICSRTRDGEHFQVWRKTIKARMCAKINEITQQLKRNRHHPVIQQARWLRSVVQGYFNYHAVPGNLDRLSSFRYAIMRGWRRALLRRSQRSRLTWGVFHRKIEPLVPRPRVLHPYPSKRFNARTQGRSRMR